MQLQQSPFLSLVSDERIRRTLPLMNQPADARLTPDVARVECVRTGGAAVLQGSIAALASQYVLGLRATNCATGDNLADEQAQASRKEDVLSTLSQMATRFRTRVGESLTTVERYSIPLEATTPSLDAFQAYTAGMKAAFSGSPRALLLFQRAVAIDPDFVLAYAQIGFRYGGLGESTSRDRACSRPTNCAIGPATPSASSSTPVRPRLHGEPGTGATNVRRCVADRASCGGSEAGIRSVALDPVFRRFPEGHQGGTRTVGGGSRKHPAAEDMISHLEALALARSGRLQILTAGIA